MEPDRSALRLENQLCFPLYAASREIIKHYRPHLEALDLTYTQYITMMVLWAENEISVKQLGSRLYLDSGTLTPLLKALEQKGYVNRFRSKEDERVLLVRLTDLGRELEEKALCVPAAMQACVPLTAEEAAVLYKLLYKLLSPADQAGETEPIPQDQDKPAGEDD